MPQPFKKTSFAYDGRWWSKFLDNHLYSRASLFQVIIRIVNVIVCKCLNVKDDANHQIEISFSIFRIIKNLVLFLKGTVKEK